MQYLLKFKTLIGYFISLNWSRVILNWICYWIELAKNNFELNIFFWIESWVFFWLNIFFELISDNFLLNWKLNWTIFDSFILNQKLNWIIFKRNSIIDWIVKLYLPWLVQTPPLVPPFTSVLTSYRKPFCVRPRSSPSDTPSHPFICTIALSSLLY